MLRTKWIVNVLRLLWVLLILNNEYAVFLSSAKHCLSALPTIQPQFILIGDPQITDRMSYHHPSFLMSIIIFYSELYMKRNYRHLQSIIQPKEIFFMGDLMDNGREWDDDFYETEVNRFNAMFQTDKPTHYMVGNHDIGFGNGAKLSLRNRFQSYFGNTSYVLETNHGYSFVVVDTISLSSDDPLMRDPVLDFLNGPFPSTPLILMTHVPLYRTKEVSCGPNRQKLNTIIPDERGYQYQNLINQELSELILSKVNPKAIYSGDDHDYCEITHHPATTEITVPTFSMAQGLKSPGVTFLYASNDTITSKVCWLPYQVGLFIHYASFLAWTLFVLAGFHVWQYIQHPKGYTHLSKEEMGLSTTSMMSAKKCIVSFLNSVKDIAIIGSVTYAMCLAFL